MAISNRHVEEFYWSLQPASLPRVITGAQFAAAGGTIRLNPQDLVVLLHLDTNGQNGALILPPVAGNPGRNVYTIYLLSQHSGETCTVDSPVDCRVASTQMTLGAVGDTVSYINRNDRYDIVPDNYITQN